MKQYDEQFLRPDPTNPGKHIDVRTGCRPISEWGAGCGIGPSNHKSGGGAAEPAKRPPAATRKGQKAA